MSTEVPAMIPNYSGETGCGGTMFQELFNYDYKEFKVNAYEDEVILGGTFDDLKRIRYVFIDWVGAAEYFKISVTQDLETWKNVTSWKKNNKCSYQDLVDLDEFYYVRGISIIMKNPIKDVFAVKQFYALH